MSRRKKRQVHYGRIILIILVVIALIVVAILGVKYVSDKLKEKETETQPIEVITSDEITIEKINYDVYKDENNELGFNFIVATLRFTSNGKVSFDLSNLVTAQDIALNSVFNYKKKIQEYGADMQTLDIADEVNSETSTVTCNVLIPYTNYENELTVNNLLGGQLVFDLNQNVHTVGSLIGEDSSGSEQSGTSVIEDDLEIFVSDSFVSTMMKHNGEDYEPGSTTRVYTFKLSVNKVEGIVTIEDAEFIQTGNSEVNKALDAGYYSEKVENIIGKQLKVGENGALFFQVYSNDDAPNYDGTLRIKLSNSNSWIEISTELK